MIDLVIFDLGRVLIDFDFKKAIRRLKAHSSKSEVEIRDFFMTTPLWDAFERGTIKPPEFFQALTRDLGLARLDYASFVPMWNDIFQVMPESVEILTQLRGRVKLAMISNVNPMHWDYVSSKHDFLRWFDIPIASFAVGLRKPEAAIYQLALKKAGIPAERAIFIDDVEAHVHAAASLGIRGHHFQTAKQLKADLKDIL